MDKEGYILLPTAAHCGVISVEEALLKRRSIREYSPEAIFINELTQILWSAQGITGAGGIRTAPSAGALYPLEIYAVIAKVKEISEGVYKYHAASDALELFVQGDVRKQLAWAALDQKFLEETPLILIIAAVYERTTIKYSSRGIRYVHMEAGHVAENICLQATALNLGTVIVGAFDDAGVHKVLNLPDDELPLCLIPVGRKLINGM